MLLLWAWCCVWCQSLGVLPNLRRAILHHAQEADASDHQCDDDEDREEPATAIGITKMIVPDIRIAAFIGNNRTGIERVHGILLSSTKETQRTDREFRFRFCRVG